jgi:hypothetical protein
MFGVASSRIDGPTRHPLDEEADSGVGTVTGVTAVGFTWAVATDGFGRAGIVPTVNATAIGDLLIVVDAGGVVTDTVVTTAEGLWTDPWAVLVTDGVRCVGIVPTVNTDGVTEAGCAAETVLTVIEVEVVNLYGTVGELGR